MHDDGPVCVCNGDHYDANCTLNVDDCMTHNCFGNSTCVDDINGYICVCLPHMTGIVICTRYFILYNVNYAKIANDAMIYIF